jgi:hypothetical protein
MSYPSFKTYINTLGHLLKRKGSWLLKESHELAKLCQVYGKVLNLDHRDRKTLLLAAYFKNLGAIYVSDYLLEQEFRDHEQMQTCLSTWFVESAELARDAGLDDVAVILEQYYLREVPQDRLARIFQVLNTWIACQQRKGWRHSMTEKEARIILEQRAQLNWSDPSIVNHFVQHSSGKSFQFSTANTSIA